MNDYFEQLSRVTAVKEFIEELRMFEYYLDDKGLETALRYCPNIAADPSIQASIIQMQNGRRALLARFEELKQPHLEYL